AEQGFAVNEDRTDPGQSAARQEQPTPAELPGEKRKVKLPSEHDVLGRAEEKQGGLGMLAFGAKSLGIHGERIMERIPEGDPGPPVAELELVQAAGEHDDGKMDLEQTQRHVGRVAEAGIPRLSPGTEERR